MNPFPKKRLRPSFGEGVRRYRAAAAAARADREAREERLEAKIDDLGKRIDALRPYTGPTRTVYGGPTRVGSGGVGSFGEHRRLMAAQSNVPFRDRTFYSREHKRYWKWHEGQFWRMRDVHNGEFFGPEYRSVTFTGDSFRAHLVRRPWAPIVTSNPTAPDSRVQAQFHPVGAVTGRFPETTTEYLAEMREKYDPDDACFKTETATMLTSLQIALLCYRADYGPSNNVISGPIGMNPDAWSIKCSIDGLAAKGLVERNSQGYAITTKGRVYVEHLRKQPLPVATEPKWEIPA